MRTAYNPAVRRRILCVYPAYARSFGTFQHAYGFFGGRVRAFMPPQGLLAVAAYLPASWEVRFADENSCAASDDDFRWADAVFISGMHIQRPRIHDVIAHRFVADAAHDLDFVDAGRDGDLVGAAHVEVAPRRMARHRADRPGGPVGAVSVAHRHFRARRLAGRGVQDPAAQDAARRELRLLTS